jgi:hypothetical protein
MTRSLVDSRGGQPTEKGLSLWMGTVLEFKIFRQHSRTMAPLHLFIILSSTDATPNRYCTARTSWRLPFRSQGVCPRRKRRPYPDDILNEGLRFDSSMERQQQ